MPKKLTPEQKETRRKERQSEKTEYFKRNEKVQLILVCQESERHEIKKAAELCGKSMNIYVLDAVRQQMAIDRIHSRGMGVIINKNGEAKNAPEKKN